VNETVNDTLAAALPDLLPAAQQVYDDAVALRRDLHSHPELGLDNPWTKQRLLGDIESLGLTIHESPSTSGVTAVIEGGSDGPTMLLRADTDALPLQEDADLAFKSLTDGHMHACGHDLHTAMLVGAAKLLHARRADIKGRVLLMFQPGEEGFHGAKHMLDDGILQYAGEVTKAFAIHVGGNVPRGLVAIKGGTQMASSDSFNIVIRGKGGHASAPHHALDPIPIACEIVIALQTMVTRRIDAFDPGVLTVGQITSGTTSNVIPEVATVLGTMRAVSERTRTLLQDGVRRVAEHIAAAHEGVAEVEVTFGFPVTVNNDDVANDVLRVGESLLGPRGTMRMPTPVMGAEDFSYVLQKVPGAMAFLGACPPELPIAKAYPNHSNLVRFDEQCMVQGMALHVAMVLDHLG
jgi:amidohydrolase